MNNKLKIIDFEKFIPDHILSRGYNYYDEGHIDEFSIDKDTCHATVLGTETYEVEIKLDSTHQYVRDTMCSCPYDQGQYCKHIVAVLYRIKDTIPSKTSGHLRVDLEMKSKDELIDMLMELVDDYPEIINRLRSSSEGDGIETIIDSYLDDYMDDGYIRYQDVHKAIKGFEIALSKVAIAEPKIQFKLCIDILNKWVDAYEDMDDSDGYLSNIKYDALDLLQQAALNIEYETDVIGTIKEIAIMLLENSKSYLDDVYVEVLRVIVPLGKFKSIREILTEKISHLLELKDKGKYIEYYKDDLVDHYYALQLFSSQEEADHWMMTHLAYRSMAKRAIDKAFDEKNYPMVIQLCLDCIKDHSGYEKEWHIFLVRAYQLSHQNLQAKEHMRKLILLGETTYYQAYKDHFDSESWNKEVVNMLNELAKEKFVPPIYEKIMIDEKQYDYMMRYVNEHPHKIFELYRHLPISYNDEMKSIMKAQVFIQFKNGSSKKDYQYRSHYLDTYVRAFNKENTITLIHELKSTFKNRKALNEVLDKYIQKIK